MTETDTTTARYRAAIVAIAPVVLFAAFVYHPYIEPPTDPAAIAAAAASDPVRWGVAHLAIAVGYALAMLAFLAVRSYLRDAGEDRWSAFGLPLIVLGSTLFVLLTGMEFALLAAAKTGGDVQAAQTELMPWFVPILIVGAVSFAFGAFGFAIGIARSAIVSKRLSRLIVGALILTAVARFVPLAPAPYLLAAASIVALWPLAFEMWNHPAARPVHYRAPMSTA